MKIKPDAREYVTWPTTGAPTGATLEARFTGDTAWHTAERIGDDARLLVAGPQAVDNPPGTIVVTASRTFVEFRLADNPEVVIRDAGVIDLDT